MAPSSAVAAFEQAGVTFWAGVPDSLLKDFCRCIEDTAAPGSHVIAANEGGAVALAAGYHLATGAVAGVYLQNSGLGNTVNPVVSLVDPTVASIPLVLVIGWRGQPGTLDEPQHLRQGGATLGLLETIGVPTRVVEADPVSFRAAVEWAAGAARDRGGPTALVVPAGTFEAYPERASDVPALPLREDALVAVVEALPADVAIVATTGKTSRELYEYRRRTGGPQRDFLTVGSMGHASQIALGVALGRPERDVCVFDGDGAAVMHLGSLVVIGEQAPPNLRHVIFDNQAHESVGGQPTPTSRADFAAVALDVGYRSAERASSLEEIPALVTRLCEGPAPALLEVRIRQGSRPDLGRPEESPAANRDAFMAWLRA